MTPLELRLYVAALLAVVYTISWRAIGSAAPAIVPVATTPITSEPQRFVWIDSLPADLRPAVALPAGWQRATRASIAPSEPVVRAPIRRVPRVRTRSS
jgi:hypothetical protein